MVEPQSPGRRIDPPAVRQLVRFALTIFVGALTLFVVVPWAGSFVVDWLWFKETGFDSVFLRSFLWKVGLFALRGAFAFAFVYGNVRLAGPRTDRALALVSERFRSASPDAPVDLGRLVPLLLFAGSFVLALLVAAAASESWLTWLLAYHGGSTGVADPLLGWDLGFYLFRLPAITSALDTLTTLTVLSLGAATALYALQSELVLGRTNSQAAPRATRHLAALLSLFFVLLAVRLWILGRADLLSSTSGPLVGASFTDDHVRLPTIALSALAALAAVGLVMYGVFRGPFVRYALVAVAAYVGVGIVARGLVPLAVQRLVVAPNELDRERPYIQRHIAATRLAWGLESVTTRDLSGEARLTMADIRANAPTITNVRLWERDLLRQTFKQIQEIRTYYDFVSVNDDRYVIDGKYRQVHLAARELNPASLPTRSFINERLTFTHGMGITMAPVNEVTDEGLPVLFVKDLPPVSTTSIKLTRPEIYYGELTNSYVFVGTEQKEFDYPAGDANMYTNYRGRGGIPVGSALRRALFAWRFGSAKILLSSDIGDSARVLFRRNVSERARTALPFLVFDPEPYLVVTDSGRLVWMLDAYTSSDHYPYAARTADGTSYMRNSVKVTVDAYDGTIDAYIAEPTDPIVQAYARIFAGIFKPLSAMPADLRRHLRYPATLFRLQAALLATFHMVEPDAFYHREDQWQLPEVGQRDQANNPFMRHIILRLPGEKEAEFIYMTPFNPRGKDNLAAWFVARMDGEHYGKLVVYRFPKQSLLYGPRQISNRIEQDTDISRQLSLWDQSGSKAIRGELLVIPIEESLVYVQPIFLRASGGTIPELKRVVVAHGNRVAMGTTLEEGLAAVFGGASERVASGATPAPGAAGTATADAGSSVAALLRLAQQHYDRAIAAQRAGNWADYGREIEALGAALRDLAARKP